MKNKRKKNLTFGDLVVAAYRTWGKAKAGELMRLAVKERLVVFQGPAHFLITAGERRMHE